MNLLHPGQNDSASRQRFPAPLWDSSDHPARSRFGDSFDRVREYRKFDAHEGNATRAGDGDSFCTGSGKVQTDAAIVHGELIACCKRRGNGDLVCVLVKGIAVAACSVRDSKARHDIAGFACVGLCSRRNSSVRTAFRIGPCFTDATSGHPPIACAIGRKFERRRAEGKEDSCCRQYWNGAFVIIECRAAAPQFKKSSSPGTGLSAGWRGDDDRFSDRSEIRWGYASSLLL